ncbi:hypothetical protein FJ251_00560 [bacterium]|nr:hypothetical protein [bacterium]
MDPQSPSTAPEIARAFSAIPRVFTAPGSVAADIKAGLAWWPGLVVLIVLTLLAGILLYPLQRDLMILDVGSGQMEGAQLDEGGGLPAPLRWSLIGGTIGGPLLGLPAVLLIVSFFYWLALMITFGGAPYRRLFTLTTYTSFIGIAYQLINTLYLRFAGLELNSMKDLQSSSLEFSLGALVSGEGFLANFLDQIGVFPLWTLWVFIGGAALLMERRRSAVTPPIVVVFLIGSVVAAFFTTLGSRFGG